MSSEMSDARARAQAREAERQRLREQRKLEAAKRSAGRSRGNSSEGDDPNDPLAAERRIWRHKQKEKAAASGDNPFGTEDDAQYMTQEDQMIAHAKKLQADNQSTLKNTIKVARETTQVGAATINKLNEQTEQFERMDNTLNETNDSLTRSERILRGMKSIGGAFTNMFSSGKSKQQPSLKATLAPQNAGSASLEEKDRLRDKQRALEEDKRRAKFPGSSPGSYDAPASSLRPAGGASLSPDDPDYRPSIQPNAKQAAALSTFEQNQRKEDEALDELSDVLGALKEQSQVINQQLRTQASMIDSIDSKVEHTGARLKKGSNTMKKIS